MSKLSSLLYQLYFIESSENRSISNWIQGTKIILDETSYLNFWSASPESAKLNLA